MITVRRAEERGHADHGWLDTRHTFSFADYYDAHHMGFRTLRVINEDRVQPGQGFGTHGHRDMEIISYVLEGELAHRDSMGTGSTIRPGEVQRMSAGTGVLHSEMNPSRERPVHFLQIWILPDRQGHPPSYEQKAFPEAERRGKLRLVASPDGADRSLSIHQDARLYLATLADGERVRHALPAGRHAWVQVARGEVTLNGQRLRAGDGAAVSDEPAIELVGSGPSPAEVLVFDLA
jgi:quercetin 2,3-dioxygenase